MNGQHFAQHARDCRVLSFLCSASIATLLAIDFAKAADLPSYTQPPVVQAPLRPAIYDWTGFYAGVNAGFGIDHFGFPFAAIVPPTTVAGTSGITSSGPVAGGQIGFNYQFVNVPALSNVVVGVEAGLDWANLTGSTSIPTPLGTLGLKTRFDDFGTLRARVGYAFDRTLLYVAGGLTFGTVTDSFTLGAPSNLAGSTTFTHSGLPPKVDTIGIGIEYAITNNWMVRAEYFYDFVISKTEVFTPAAGSSVAFNTRAAYHIARVGLDYKFDWFSPPNPIVAKY